MLILVTYDVNTLTKEGRRRLRQVAKACEGYGQRVQFSVFECQVDETHWTELRQRLLGIIHTDEDTLRFYFLPGGIFESCEHHGLKPSFDAEGPLVL